MRIPGLTVLILSHFLIADFTFAQVSYLQTSYPQRTKNPTVIHEKPGHVYSTIMVKDSIRVIDEDMTEMMDIIVEYKDEPLFVQQQQNKLQKISTASFQSRQTQFTNELFRIYESANKAYSTTFLQPQKKIEYYRVFNGLSLSVPKAMISHIASLPYVKKVHIDKKIKSDINESVKLIGADSVWYKYNDRGDSIIVGIIDSGIDYMHPALGGGFGKGYKVIGGYDFVNKDNDPMDDAGHGTHVAGIIAADGDSIQGVAPKALLMAYKVLDAHGYGYESDILAAIEMTADPNGDNNYNDKLDIVNMSLGDDAGNPFDAMTEAVNNAVRLGVTYCVAAGNMGAFNSIGSPGTAELAITVGASDKTDMLADFSSKGPTKRTFLIKPEILAPGVNITSSILNGKYESHSGTSMAAPVVSGICALIKKKHKDWSPQMIKSALMTTSKDLGYDIMSQGAGRADAMKAINVCSFAIPSLLNFGLDSLSGTTWTKTDTIEIGNKSSSIQHYSVAISGLYSGMAIQSDQNNFILQPGESRDLIFTLNVDNNILPDVAKSPNTYSGIVNIFGTIDSLKLPWAFVKSPFLVLRSDLPISGGCVFNENGFHNVFYPGYSSDLYSTELVIPKGKYSIFISFNKTETGKLEKFFIFKDSVEINSYKEVFINSSEADKTINFHGVDETGRELSNLPNSYNGLIITSGTEQAKSIKLLTGLYNNGSFKTSAAPKSIKFYTAQLQNGSLTDHAYRIVQYPIFTGVNGNVELKNSPGDFLKQNISITLPPGQTGANAQFFMNIRLLNDIYGSVFFVNDSSYIKDTYWTGALYITPEVDKNLGFTAQIFADKSADDPVWFLTGSFRTRGDTVMCFIFNEMPDIFYSQNRGAMNFGDGPIHPVWIDTGDLTAEKGSSGGYKFMFCPGFSGQLSESRNSDMYHSLYSIYNSQNNLVKSDTVINSYSSFELPAGKYRYELNHNNYTVAGRWGKAKLTADLDLTRKTPSPPVITTLRVLNPSGIPVSMLRKGDNAQICFSVRNLNLGFIDTAETKIFLKKHDSSEWEELRILKRTNHIYLGIIFTAETGKFSTYDSSLIDMKIVAQNKDKNRTEWILEPAFAVGDYIYTAIEDKNNTLSTIPKVYKLYNNYPNPFNPTTTISYDLPIETFVELKLYDILGREIMTLVNEVQKKGTHSFNLNADNLSTGVYICRLKADKFEKSQKLILLK